MVTIYIDFDNTIVESNQKIIEILNKKYNTSKTEEDLKDYNYNSIVDITEKEKNEIFESDEFFKNLSFKKGFLDFFNDNKDDYKIIIVSKGSALNLDKKEEWLQEHLSGRFEFIGIQDLYTSKSIVDMADSIQIDDCTKELNTNAQIKILYKSSNNFPWQQDYENTSILIANTWEEISDVVSFYSKYDYKSLEGFTKCRK